MLTYIFRRILVAIPVLLVASFVLFAAVRVTVDPAAQLRAGNKDPYAYQRERARLGLDRSLPVQYGTWLGNFVRGDWGEGDHARDDVRSRILKSLWTTFQIICWGILLSAIIAISIGVYSAIHQYSKLDYTFTGLSYVGLAMPPFWFGLLLIAFVGTGLFGTGVKPFDTLGLHTGDQSGLNLDYARHLVLPVIVLTVQIIASWSRYMRASMLDSMGSEYIRMARAKGVPQRRVVMRHGLRNSLIPLVSVMAIDIGALFGGLVITETLFGIEGMGKLFVDRFGQGDATLLSSWVVVTAIFVIMFNLLADILYGVLDPRVRLK